jgi:CBS domain-containing protein
MSLVSDILHEKGSLVHAISSQATVFEAIDLMVQHGIGALVVVEAGALVGMLTERDYLRKVALAGRTSRTTLVHEIMSEPIISVRRSEGVDHCLALMTERRVRHLPVVEHGQLLGLVSMGDLVRQRVLDKQFEINRLVEYIQTAAAPA